MKTSIANSFKDCGLTPISAPEPSNTSNMNSIAGLLSVRPKLPFQEFDFFKAERKEVKLKVDPINGVDHINGGSLLKGSDFEDDSDSDDDDDDDDIDEQEDEDKFGKQIQAGEDDEVEDDGEY